MLQGRARPCTVAGAVGLDAAHTAALKVIDATLLRRPITVMREQHPQRLSHV